MRFELYDDNRYKCEDCGRLLMLTEVAEHDCELSELKVVGRR